MAEETASPEKFPKPQKIKKKRKGLKRLCAAFLAAAAVGAGAFGIGKAWENNNHDNPVNPDPVPTVVQPDVPPTVLPDVLNAFNQSAARGQIADDPELGNWDAVLQHQKDMLQDPAKAQAYKVFLAQFDGLKGEPIDRLAYDVNAIVNNEITYTTDQDQYGTDEYWAAPIETALSRKGDCEDFAILQKAVLRYLGVPEDKMFLTAVNAEGNAFGGPDHVILLLNEAPDGQDMQLFVLNDAPPVLPADNNVIQQTWIVNGYMPASFVLIDARNEDGYWTTGFNYRAAGIPPPVAQVASTQGPVVKISAKQSAPKLG